MIGVYLVFAGAALFLLSFALPSAAMARWGEDRVYRIALAGTVIGLALLVSGGILMLAF